MPSNRAAELRTQAAHALPYEPSVPCAQCARGTDPLRAACVGATEQRVYYFCSRACRSAYVKAETALAATPPAPSAPTPAPLATTLLRASAEPVSRRVVAPALDRRSLWAPLAAFGGALSSLSPRYEARASAAFTLLAVAAVLTSQASRTRHAAGLLGWLLPPLGIGLLGLSVVRAPSAGPIVAAAVGVLLIWLRERRLRQEAARLTAAHEERTCALARRVAVVVPALAGGGTLLQERPASGVRVGDTLQLQAGQVVPVDAIVRAGEARVLPYLGAQREVARGPGSTLLAGARVLVGTLRVEATRVGVRARDVASERARGVLRQHVDRIGLSALALLAGVAALSSSGLVTLLAPLGAGLLLTPLLGLAYAAHASLAAAAGAASTRGIRFRDLRALAQVGRADTAVVRIEGVLTEDAYRLHDVRALAPGYDARSLLGLAVAAEQAAEDHPLARALFDHATPLGIAPVALRRVAYARGRGISALTDGGGPIVLGNRDALLSAGVSVAVADAEAHEAERAGHTVVFLAVGGHVRGFFVFARPLRDGARAALRALVDSGLEVVLLSSDQRTTAEAIARALGTGQLKAELDAEARAAEARHLCDGEARLVAIARQPRDEALLAAADVALSVDGAGRIQPHAVATASPELAEVAAALILARRARRVVQALGGLLGLGALGALLAAAGTLPPIGAALFALVVDVLCLGLAPVTAAAMPPEHARKAGPRTG